jgi:hypothetical protein
MFQDAERIKKLITFKNKLEARIEQTASELKELQATLEAVNSVLLEKGFKQVKIPEEVPETATIPPSEKAEEEVEPPFSEPGVEPQNAVPLKTVTGEPLAVLHISEDSVRVVPDKGENFDINTPPFNHFLVERVLLKMQERDSELVRAGQLAPEKMFCYNIVREGEILKEIVIKNVDSERLRELKSSLRWTLEKMHEKTKTQPE